MKKISVIAVTVTVLNIVGIVGFDSATASEKHQGLILSQDLNLPSGVRDAVGGDLLGLLSSDSRFSTLATALKSTGLLEKLQEGGPFTLFAPTNEAFEALPEGTLESLMQPENSEQLTKILQHHVISGEVTSDELSSGEVETAAGSSVNVDVGSDSVTVGDAKVIDSDISTENGVVHVIDKVMLPE
ncbi:MAG: fasciclin domain-containing protein [Cyanobacteriota bacterium]|nr:fasciclin domain-containing protein [Cyanobacteriota bacterium]